MVTTAIGHGRRAAEAIERKFLGAEAGNGKLPLIGKEGMRLDHYEKIERGTPVTLEAAKRLEGMEVEGNLGFTPEQVVTESQRCMSCGYCFDCEKCWLFCQDQAVVKPSEKGELYTYKMENCTGCKKCAEECPCGFIDML